MVVVLHDPVVGVVAHGVVTLVHHQQRELLHGQVAPAQRQQEHVVDEEEDGGGGELGRPARRRPVVHAVRAAVAVRGGGRVGRHTALPAGGEAGGGAAHSRLLLQQRHVIHQEHGLGGLLHSSELRIQSTVLGAQNTENSTESSEYQVQCSELRIQSTVPRAQSSKLMRQTVAKPKLMGYRSRAWPDLHAGLQLLPQVLHHHDGDEGLAAAGAQVHDDVLLLGLLQQLHLVGPRRHLPRPPLLPRGTPPFSPILCYVIHPPFSLSAIYEHSDTSRNLEHLYSAQIEK